MNSQNIENLLKQAIKWLCFLTMLTPLLVAGSTLFPYVFSKAITFQILTEIMLFCYVWLLYSTYRRTGSIRDYLPRPNLLFWSLTAFFAVLILSTIFSVDSTYSFWSKQERMDGLFSLAHFFAFFFVLAGAIKDGKSWLQILDASIVASFIVSLYAIGQKFGLFFNPYGERLTSTLGNAAFLGTYLLFNIFFAILLLVQRKNKYLKIWYSAVIILEIVILLLTQTRGTIWGMIGGFLIFGFGFFFFSQPNRLKKYALILIIISLLAGGTLLAARNSQFVKNNSILNRLTDISFKAGTGKTRIISWQIGLSAFLAKPLLGWGQENYYVAFNKHLDPVFFTYSGETFDRAHNKIIDLLVMGGLLGLLAYCFVFLAALIALWKKRKEGLIIVLVLVALLGAYFVQNIVLFDMPISYLMFFLSLGLIYFITKPRKKENDAPAQKKQVYFSSWPISLAWLASIVIIFVLWSGNIKPLIASQRSIDAQQILAAQKPSDTTLKLALEKFKDSVSSNSLTNPETGKILPPIFISIANSPQISPANKSETLKFLAEYLESAIKEMPLFIDYYLNLTDVYGALSNENPSYLKNGEQTMTKLIELYPKVPQLYYKLIINRILAQDLNQARDLCQKTIQLNPRLPNGWWYLGMNYYYAGEYNLSQENLEKAISLGYDYRNLNSIFALGQVYDKINQYEKAITYYEEALKISPQEPWAQFNMAKNYKNLGQKEKARDLAERLLASSTPQNAPTIKEFLDSLK